MAPISSGATMIAVAVMLLATSLCRDGAAKSATQPASEKKDSAKTQSAAEVGGQIKELQKQLSELKAQVSETQSSCIVAAGTATWTRPPLEENKTSTRVSLKPEIAAKLGKDYIVLLTNRAHSGAPYLSCYWKIADGGFDITLVDPTLPEGSTRIYASKNTSYLIDWIVVKK